MKFLDERLPARFWDKCIPEPNSGCWLWLGALHHNGYGQYWPTARYNRRSHRVAYEALVGAIPDGLDLDHLCRQRSCCNPAHLEPVTRAENLRRGETGDPNIGQRTIARALLQTHCKHGHLYDEANTGRTCNGSRFCRTCTRDRNREYMRLKRASRKKVL